MSPKAKRFAAAHSKARWKGSTLPTLPVPPKPTKTVKQRPCWPFDRWLSGAVQPEYHQTDAARGWYLGKTAIWRDPWRTLIRRKTYAEHHEEAIATIAKGSRS